MANSKSPLSRFVNENSRPLIFNAEYLDQEISSFQGNPNIEALPLALDRKGWIDALVREPNFDNNHRTLSDPSRKILISQIREFYQPLEIPLLMAEDFDEVLRLGYIYRNPFNPEYRQGLLASKDKQEIVINKIIQNELDNDAITTDGFVISGPSGMGKTRGLKRTLSHFPQLIHHAKYKDGRPLLYTQITYLMFDLPPNGTLRTFAETALIAVSKIFKKDYYSLYSMQHRANTNLLLQGFLAVASEHYLGALILDELPNLRGSKEGRIILNYLVYLSNEFRIPVIFIGTPNVDSILTKEFRLLRRRSGSQEYNHWMPMKQDGKDWNIFMQSLFQYQYVKNPVTLTPELSAKLHDISGGITDLAIKMFIASQKEAINNESVDGESETLTPALFQHVANHKFAWAKDAVKALRIGTKQALMKYQDLYMENLDKESTGDNTPERTRNGGEEESGQQSDASLPNENNVPSKAKKKVSARNKDKTSELLLPGIVEQGWKNNLSAHESLKNNGWIGSVEDYL